MENDTKNFHFMEIDWIVSFPICGNTGKYLNYSVIFVDRKEGKFQSGKLAKPEEIVESREFEQRYPHTIGFYKGSCGEGAEFKPKYLEIRRINSVEELWLFLNALDI